VEAAVLLGLDEAQEQVDGYPGGGSNFNTKKRRERKYIMWKTKKGGTT